MLMLFPILCSITNNSFDYTSIEQRKVVFLFMILHPIEPAVLTNIGFVAICSSEPKQCVKYNFILLISSMCLTLVLHAPAFFSCFVKYCPDDGLLRPKLVADSRIIIKYYIVVSDGRHI